MYYIVWMFILGAVMGSFYHVVGSRLPKGESFINVPSHCTKCNKRLSPMELIPIISYIFQRGKCKKCGYKLSIAYPLIELITGLLFMISYIIFGFSFELLIALIFISILIIIVVSDLETMIIPDSVLIFGAVSILIVTFIDGGFTKLLYSLLSGVGAFTTMLLFKLLGDFLFKKESMGGGDIKLLFVFGITLGYFNAVLSIFVGSIIGLPISLLMVKNKSNHEVPFGPFLAVGAIVILLTGIDLNFILSLYE